MKKQILALSACLLFAAGCGGGGNGSLNASSSVRGGAAIAIHWPKSTRLIPGDAQCIQILLSGQASPTVTLTNGTNYVTSPGSGGTSNVTTVQLTPGNYTVTAKAWPGATPSAGGSPIATGTASLAIVAGQTAPFAITMASTIDHIEVTANGTTIEVSTNGTVTAGNGGSATTLPLIPTLLNPVTVVPKDASSDNLVLFPASLVGNEITNSDTLITVGGASSSLTNSAGSVLKANLTANASATTGYSSSVTVHYNEGGNTIDTFTFPVAMQAITFGTPSQISVNSQWSVLNSVSQGSATGYVMVAYAGIYSATAITTNIPAGYVGSIGGIAASSDCAFRDGNDGFWLTNASYIYVYSAQGTVNQAINNHNGFRFLANSLSLSGSPFVVDSTGAYEYGVTTPVNSTAIQRSSNTGFMFAAGSGPDGKIVYYTKMPSGTVTVTNQAGVDATVTNNTPDAMTGTVVSPLLYAIQGGVLSCETVGGVLIGQVTVDSSADTMNGLGVFVDPTTGQVDGTAIGTRSSVPIAYAF